MNNLIKRAAIAVIVALVAVPAYADFPTQIIPAPLHGCGTMLVSTTSAAITTGNVTLCPNSPSPLPTLPTTGAPISLEISVQGDSGSLVMFCPFGGTCATVGRKLMVGEGKTTNVQIGTVPPTVVTPSGTATIFIGW